MGPWTTIKQIRFLKFYKIENKFVFYFSYIFISTLIILSWIFFSLVTLIVFLLIASHHFGKEDTAFLIKKHSNFDQIIYVVKVL